MVELINRREAFYSGELAAWHAHERSVALEPTGVSLDNQQNAGLPDDLVEDPYSPGAPLNVKTTARHAPRPTYIPPLAPTGLR